MQTAAPKHSPKIRNAALIAAIGLGISGLTIGLSGRFRAPASTESHP